MFDSITEPFSRWPSRNTTVGLPWNPVLLNWWVECSGRECFRSNVNPLVLKLMCLDLFIDAQCLYIIKLNVKGHTCSSWECSFNVWLYSKCTGTNKTEELVSLEINQKKQHNQRNLFEFICIVRKNTCLTVGLGNSLQLVFLLDGVRVRWTLEKKKRCSY